MRRSHRLGTSVSVYAPATARDIAAELARRFWPRPVDPVGAEAQLAEIDAALKELSRVRPPEADSGLDVSQFILYVDQLTTVLSNQTPRAPDKPHPSGQDHEAAFENACYIMLAAQEPSRVRVALRHRDVLVEAGRPRGITQLSRRRFQRQLEATAPRVRLAHRELVTACTDFLGSP